MMPHISDHYAPVLDPSCDLCPIADATTRTDEASSGDNDISSDDGLFAYNETDLRYVMPATFYAYLGSTTIAGKGWTDGDVVIDHAVTYMPVRTDRDIGHDDRVLYHGEWVYINPVPYTTGWQ
jgi:hypothetical protein